MRPLAEGARATRQGVRGGRGGDSRGYRQKTNPSCLGFGGTCRLPEVLAEVVDSVLEIEECFHDQEVAVLPPLPLLLRAAELPAERPAVQLENLAVQPADRVLELVVLLTFDPNRRVHTSLLPSVVQPTPVPRVTRRRSGDRHERSRLVPPAPGRWPRLCFCVLLPA